MTTRGFQQHSAVIDDALHLALAPALTPDGIEQTPQFFSGELLKPRIFVACLRLLGALPQRSYTTQTSRGYSDPILTAHGNCLSMEAFSACNSVYAQVVVDAAAFTGGTLGYGTTNVDISPETDAALLQVANNDTLGVSIGETGLELTTKTAHAVERPVQLPQRWIRGLAESSAAARTLQHHASLTGTQARTFIASTPNTQGYITVTSSGVQRHRYPTAGSMYVHNLQRIELLRRLAPFIERLDLYTSAQPNNSAQPGTASTALTTQNSTYTGLVAHLPHTTVTLLLTPSSMRGFSGEGKLLYDLAAQESLEHAPAELGFRTDIDPAQNVNTTELEALGILGWSVVHQRFFHRQLPFDAYQVSRNNPRLAKAQQLQVEWLDTAQAQAYAAELTQQSTNKKGDDAANPEASHGAAMTIPVAAKVGNYRVELNPDYCACRWFAHYGTSRGPCKHLIATHQAIELLCSQATQPDAAIT